MGLVRLAWNEEYGTVTIPFNEWRSVDADIRAFRNLSERWSAAKYKELWEQAKRIVDADPKPPSPLFGIADRLMDAFDPLVDKLWQYDYDWMIQVAVVKDAVTAYEVYVEKALDEVLEWHHLRMPRSTRWPSPGWHDLVQLHRFLGIKAETPGIRRIRNLRHILTHQRGQLRTPELRASYGQPDPTIPTDVITAEEFAEWHDLHPIDMRINLTPQQVSTALDTLARRVRTIDPLIWQLTYGRESLPRREDIEATLAKLRDRS